MTTGDEVRKISFSPLNTSLASVANSGPRWSIVGLLSARSTRSGTLVGPGIWRKCRPLLAMRNPSSPSFRCVDSTRTIGLAEIVARVRHRERAIGLDGDLDEIGF